MFEVRRVLAIPLCPEARQSGRDAFLRDWERMAIVALDTTTCAMAADLAEYIGVRTLDALHLAAGSRVGAPAPRLVTFDTRLATAARQLGWPVVGA
jgi:predicted nucleic acid-binding protein